MIMEIMYWISIVIMIVGAVMLHFKYDEHGLKRLTLFFTTVLIMAVGQGLMTYQYVVLRGGFSIHNCIYGVFLALLLGAGVLWSSKLMYKFEYERFRVLLGVIAVIAGWLGGNGIDLVVAYGSGFGLLESSLAVYMLCLGAILVMIADLVGIFENFSLKKQPLLVLISRCTVCVGIAMMIGGGIIG